MKDEILKLCEKCGIQGLVIDGESISDYCAEPHQLEAFYKSAFNAGIEAAASEQLAAVTQQLAVCERERVFQANAHKMAQDALLEQGQQLATVTKERDELVEVVSKAVKLNSFREFNDHIPAMKAALAKVGADKTGEV